MYTHGLVGKPSGLGVNKKFLGVLEVLDVCSSVYES